MMFIIRAGIQILADHPGSTGSATARPADWFRFQKAVPTGRVWTSKDIRDAAGVAGHPRHPPHHRPRALVALLGQSAVGHQRHRLLRPALLDRPVASAGARHVGCVPQRGLDRDPVCATGLSGGSQLDALQRPAANHLFHHRVRRHTGFDRNRAHAEPGDPKQAGPARGRAEPAGSPIHPLHLVLYSCCSSWRTGSGVRHQPAAEHEPYVRRRGEQLLDRDPALYPGHGDRGAGLVGRLAFHDPARPGCPEGRVVHDRLAQGLGRVVGAECPAHGEGHLAAFLDQRHHAEMGRVRRAVGGQLRELPAPVDGLVEHPREFSLAELRAMPKQEQITTHFCIQGWSGVAKWVACPCAT